MFIVALQCSDALDGHLGCHAIALMRVMDFVGADVICSNLWEEEMKLKDLGYALIGVLTATKQDKLDAEVAKLEFELKQKMHQDFVERVAQRKRETEQQQHNFKTRGEALLQIAENQVTREDRCNHRKGGNGLMGITKGMGDSDQYAVIKHTHRNGDTHVNCLRCGKTWMPGDEGYYKAKNFFTRNSASSDVLVATTMKNGTVTSDFAEAWRKWNNVRPYAGLAFSPKEGIAEATRLAQELQSTYPEQKRPVTFRKEFIPTLVKTEAPAKDDNPKFNIVNVSESLVS